MIHKAPVISIICPTYNHEAYIAQALDGFVMQKTSFPFEIIVHDDASTDGTAAIVRQYEEKYPDLFSNIYQKENQFSKAIGNISRITFAAARGKYLVLCEGDDYWTDPLKLQKQVNFLENNPDFVICFHQVEVIYEGKSEKNYLSNPIQEEITAFEDLAKGNYIHTVSCMFRNNIIEKFPKWFSETVVGDYVLHLLQSQYGKIKYIAEPMAVYRVLPTGLWENHTIVYRAENMITAVRNCRDFFYPRGVEQFERQLYGLITKILYIHLETGNTSELRKYYRLYLKYLKYSSAKQFLFLTKEYLMSFAKRPEK